MKTLKTITVILSIVSSLANAQNLNNALNANSDSTSIDPNLINSIKIIKPNLHSNTGNNTSAGSLTNTNPLFSQVLLQCDAYLGQYNIPNPTANQFHAIKDINPYSTSYGQISFPSWQIIANGGTVSAPTGCPSSASIPVTQTLDCAPYVGNYGIPINYSIGLFTRTMETNPWNPYYSTVIALAFDNSGCSNPASP
jgi:hypothetical protein